MEVIITTEATVFRRTNTVKAGTHMITFIKIRYNAMSRYIGLVKNRYGETVRIGLDRIDIPAEVQEAIDKNRKRV